jgi:predicted ATPase
MVGKLNRLSDQTREALKELACLGNAVEIDTLRCFTGTPSRRRTAGSGKPSAPGSSSTRTAATSFLHDRIQQAAYSLIPEANRAEDHLRIGRALLAGMTPDDLDQHLFDVANQFNRGIALVTRS